MIFIRYKETLDQNKSRASWFDFQNQVCMIFGGIFR